MEKSSTKRESSLVAVFGYVGIFSIIISLFIMGFQVLAWLKNDYWGKIAVWKIIPSTIEDPYLGWSG